MLLTDILRDEWKFPGYIVSDCGAIDDIYLRHKVAPTPPQAAALAREDRHGSRLRSRRIPNLVDAVKQGLITEAQIDIVGEATVPRALQARHVRLDRRQVRWAQHSVSAISISRRTTTLASQVARESMVLLKNERNTLPLSKTLEAPSR